MSSSISSFLQLFQDMLDHIIEFVGAVYTFLMGTPRDVLADTVIDEILEIVGIDPLFLDTPVLWLILGSGITFVLIYSIVRWAIP